jgi:two-component system response regulator YesN
VIDYVEANYSNEELSLSWIAKKVVFLNTDYVGRLFKKETGQNFNPYLCALRIEYAKELLRQNPQYNIVDVAQQVGLCKNPQYFSNLFKQHVGITPRMYKLQFQDTAKQPLYR